MLEGQGQEWNAGASTSHKEHVVLNHIPQTNNDLGLLPFCTHRTHWRSRSRHPDCLLSSRATVPPHRPGSPLQAKHSRMSFINAVYMHLPVCQIQWHLGVRLQIAANWTPLTSPCLTITTKNAKGPLSCQRLSCCTTGSLNIQTRLCGRGPASSVVMSGSF